MYKTPEYGTAAYHDILKRKGLTKELDPETERLLSELDDQPKKKWNVDDWFPKTTKEKYFGKYKNDPELLEIKKTIYGMMERIKYIEDLLKDEIKKDQADQKAEFEAEYVHS